MELATISQVSKMFDVSTRTLRYYEKIGLLQSQKKDDYSYRVYDDHSISRLRQILVLRKLRIPLKQIRMIFEHADTITMLEVFMQSLSEIDDEMTALSTMRIILSNFIDDLRNKSDISLKAVLFSNESMLKVINSLSLTKINFKEEKSMDELNKASQSLAALKNVRIVHLPPCTVAASHYIGENPEENAGNQLCGFVKSNKLYNIKPDARVFGFNHPNPTANRPVYGYELWVTIPNDLEVKAPLVKKHFQGGLFAAHTIVLGNFNEWEWLIKWVTVDNPKYEANSTDDGGECMSGLLEEHLNWVYHASLNWPDSDEHQLDLLFPVKLKGGHKK